MAIKLARTPSSAGNQKIFTFSTWYKRSFLALGSGATGLLMAYYGNSSRYTSIGFDLDDTLEVFGGEYTTTAPAAYNIDVVTLMKFRDTNSWYHIVVAVDTTQATNTDRVKIWVNGVLQAVEGNYGSIIYPTQNSDTFVNSTIASHYLCENGQDNRGYMAHTHLIDGTAYDASTFGESDANGVWTPKTSPSVTYGTNGFFMKYENSSNFGTDSSPNGNTLAVTGTPTQTLDTPSNVYATLNSLIPSSSISFSNGNTTFTNSATAHRSVASTLAVSKGKWYAEVKIGSLGGSYPSIGIFDSDVNFNSATYFTQLSGGWGYNSNGSVYNNDSGVIGGLPTWTTNDIIGVAVDCDNDKVYWSKNGTWVNSADPSAGTGGISITADKTWYFAGHSYDTGTDPIQNFNFGNGYFGTTAVSSAGSNGNGAIFEYDVPTGYYALNTKNLATYG